MELKFKVCGEVPADFAEQVQEVLNHWEEGRYLFCVEMLQTALREIMDAATRRSLRDKYFKIYGNEMVEEKPNWHTAKWVIEAQKEFKEMKERLAVPRVCSPPEVK